jgi:polyhydroxyalkanoate synthesis regulator phasin
MTDEGDPLTDENGDPIYVSDEFLERLEAVDETRDRIESLQEELQGLDIGLDESDTKRLLWARLSGWSLSDVQGALDAVDEVSTRSTEDLVVRLVAQLGNMTQEETEEFLQECDRLRRKYGNGGGR